MFLPTVTETSQSDHPEAALGVTLAPPELGPEYSQTHPFCHTHSVTPGFLTVSVRNKIQSS